MARQGHAWAFVRYSRAQGRGLGIWQGEAMPAWEWAMTEPETSGCAIKGNVTSNGRIYHTPSSPWYAQIRMTAAKGKRWFCTEAEAIAAGWDVRPPMRARDLRHSGRERNAASGTQPRGRNAVWQTSASHLAAGAFGAAPAAAKPPNTMSGAEVL
jgi:hypothetical protein